MVARQIPNLSDQVRFLAPLPKNKDKRRPYDFKTIEAVPFWEYDNKKIKTVNVNNLCIISDMIDKALKSIESADVITGDLAQFQARVDRLKALSKPTDEVKKAA